MYVIGLDIGTTGTKAIIVDERGKIAGDGYSGYKLITDGVCVEQDAEEWWTASKLAIGKALGALNSREVEAISVSSQGGTTVALDAAGNAIGNAITWLDSRSSSEANQMRQELGDDYVYKTTGWRISPAMDSAKIMNMKKNGYCEKAVIFASTLEFINRKLVGTAVIDPTNAGIRQLFNISTGIWDKKILEVIGCTEKELPMIEPTGKEIGRLCANAAKELNLCDKVRVFNGAHDQYCASLGSGAVEAGDMLISSGTTWAVMGITKKALATPSYIASCPHPVKGLYGNMVSLSGAGTSFQWIKDSIFKDESFEEIDRMCEKRVAKCRDLFFIPALSGAAYPLWVSEAKGGFLGADLSTDRYDLALAAMESAAFSVKAAIEDFVENGCPTNSVRIMGGATKSKIWMSILRSVIDIPIIKMSVADTCALGAAAIALTSMGEFKSYKDAANSLTTSDEIQGCSENVKAYYAEKYKEFRKIFAYTVRYYKGEQI